MNKKEKNLCKMLDLTSVLFGLATRYMSESVYRLENVLGKLVAAEQADARGRQRRNSTGCATSPPPPHTHAISPCNPHLLLYGVVTSQVFVRLFSPSSAPSFSSSCGVTSQWCCSIQK